MWRPMRRGVNRLRSPIRRRRKRLKRIWSRYIWRRLDRLKQHILLFVWYKRTPNRSVETSNQIHIISPSGNLLGGSSLHAVSIFDELKKSCKVSLWTDYKVHPEMAEKYPIKQIIPERFEFPETGTLVFVDTYFYIGPWVRYAFPRRIIVVANVTMPPTEFHRKLRKLSKIGRREVEVTYFSELVRKAVNYPGPILRSSLINLDRFVPSAGKPSASTSTSFTVGRMSRADPKKHHSDDSALYRRLVDYGCRVRIMGPSPSLKAELSGLESVTLLPAFAQEAPAFLQGLDCFFYRHSSDEWHKSWPRVISEAMACGLPVVCHNSGVYDEIIDHGQNGFLFDTQQQALEILLRLKEDPALRESISKAARETVEQLFSPARRLDIVDFYLR